MLAADVRLVGDGGGKAPAFAKDVSGADNVALLLASVFPTLTRMGLMMEPRDVNGQPGAILRDRDDQIVNAWSLDLLDGQIQTFRTVLNPDKLAHLGPVADPWAVFREAKETRRHTD